MDRKAFVAVLVDEMAEGFGRGLRMFIREHEGANYICAKARAIDENYVYLTLDQALPSGSGVEVELALPHACIKAMLSGTEADVRSLGFPWRVG